MATKIGPKTVTQRDRSKNLVFCIDAAHSDSYGGEPADNLFADPNNFGGADWNQKNGTWAVSSDPGPHGNGSYSCTATNSDPYAYSNLVRDVATGNITFSCWVKGTGSTVGKSGDIRINFVAGGGNATGGNITQGWGPLSGNWQRVSVTQNVTGAGKIKVGIETPNSAVAGDVVYVSDPQLEQSQATTPFTATFRTTTNAITNISGVGAQGTNWVQGSAADTYGLGGLFRPTTRKVLASEDSNRGHIGAVYWDLDGSDEYIATGLQPDFIHTNATLIIWCSSSDLAVGMTHGNHNGKRWYLGVYGNYAHGGCQNQNTYSSHTGKSLLSTYGVSTDDWMMLALVADSTVARVYVNATQDHTFAYTQSSGTNPDTDFSIGGWTNPGVGNWWDGRVATCMMWSAALTAKEIKDIYIAQKGRFGK